MTNTSLVTWGVDDEVWLTYAYVSSYTTEAELNAEGVINNVTSGVGKLTTQFPTILLFVGIGLLLFVLIGVLAYVIKKMSSMGGSNKNFQ